MAQRSYDDLAFAAMRPTPRVVSVFCTSCATRQLVDVGDTTCPTCGTPLPAPAEEAADASNEARVSSLAAALQRLLGGGEAQGLSSEDFVAESDLSAVLERLQAQAAEQGGAPPAKVSAVEGLKRYDVKAMSDVPVTAHLSVKGLPGEIVAIPAAFTPNDKLSLTAPLVLCEPLDAAGDITNRKDLHSSIAVVDRGTISFADKARRLQELGCIGVIVVQTFDVWPYTMTDSKSYGKGVTIPMFMVKKEHGEKLKQHVAQRRAKQTTEGGAAESKEEAAAPRCAPSCVGRIDMDGANVHCAICQDCVEPPCVLVQMPCQHLYHKDCLEPWLKLRNSCPNCRYELPTEDANYESKKRKGAGEPEHWESWYSQHDKTGVGTALQW